ncbi:MULTISPECIES: adenylate/guanylate cyclase domain-containing protein [Mycobacteriaceae]|uniref:YHS domain-containing protein n=1 Tax=Mycolicibacterium gadium TaxID=1794 RepID=A0ABT6GZP8_MYCGU|nr:MULTISPECIES: adenylate/guanylate cyclase domain-containing protein [Mycobacteriaceae]MDG5486814.1 YHS domain-containing protein [Mycolicibacterium gadium]MDX1882587.1 adenylate/guanylate cyclase domain-containing protein [Mycolicibacterium sp. 120270]
MTESESVEATFAFVDLSGFSVLTEMCGDEQAASLAGRLLAVTRDSLWPGVTIVKTMGDAVMLRSSKPEQMVATILQLADRAADEDGFLALRAGIHHGSAVHRDNDYFGHGVNVAARITALAGAGQAVVTDNVRQACAQLGLSPDPLGAKKLRNIATPMEVYAVCLPAARYPTDPVCRVRVDPGTAASHLRHADRDWWFCSPECAQRFAAAPAQYASVDTVSDHQQRGITRD